MLSRLFVPDTVNYMIAGYLVVVVMIIGYISSLILRLKKATQKVEVLRNEQK